jgi:mannose-6-phosphate isomerase-like protein (cupin superfamily)
VSDSDAPRVVSAGQDRFGELRGLGVSRVDYKLLDPGGAILILENTFHLRGGPPRHVHLHQDEWFYVVEGEFAFEIGKTTLRLGPGDSVLGPRGVPHVWACAGGGHGRILIAFTPAGQMEAFFREVTRNNSMPPQDPALWRAHGMEVVGPPLAVG